MSSRLLPPPRAAAAAARRRLALRRVDALRSAGRRTPLAPRPGGAPRPVRVAYLMPRTGPGGGARVILDHCRLLAERGFEVTVLGHGEPPDWYPGGPPYVRVSPGVELAELAGDAHVVVGGFWDQLPACRVAAAAPLVHFEQGGAHLFEDLDEAQRRAVGAAMAAADRTLTVSEQAARLLQARFGVAAEVVPNGVDGRYFHPEGPRLEAPRPYVVCVGSDEVAFKGVADVLAAAAAWRPLGGPDVVWVTPTLPRVAPPAGVRVVVAPGQARLAAIYRGAVAYVCASRYESFGLPGLEAMACGTAVVTTDHPGQRAYARHRQNALVVPVGDVDALGAAVLELCGDPGLRERLVVGGLETAAGRSWAAAGERLAELVGSWASLRRAPGGAGRLTWDLDGVEFDPGDLEVLRARAEATDARSVAVPVVAEAFEGHLMASWTVVARRSSGRDAVERLYVPGRAARFRPVVSPGGYERFAAGDFEGALAAYEAARAVAPDPETAAVATRWIALCLIELGRDREALALAAAALFETPDYADLVYSAAVAAAFAGVELDAAAARGLVAASPMGAAFPEWIVGVPELLEARLVAAAPTA